MTKTKAADDMTGQTQQAACLYRSSRRHNWTDAGCGMPGKMQVAAWLDK
jgi:hypothetical protein